jgi:hypothetical protein
MVVLNLLSSLVQQQEVEVVVPHLLPVNIVYSYLQIVLLEFITFFKGTIILEGAVLFGYS